MTVIQAAARALTRVPLLLIVGLLALLAPASPAQAHAALVSSNPEAGGIIGAPPTEITLVFNETVTPIANRIQVIAPDGKRISESVTSANNTITIKVRKPDQPLGTYLVSYRIVSGDTHPVGNAMIFSVGAPSARPAEADPNAIHPSAEVAGPVLKFIGYAGLTLAVGPALFLALLWPRRLSRRGPIRLVRAGLVLIGVATLGGLWTQAPLASGAPLWDVSLTELGDVFAGPYGQALSARLALLAIIAALLPPILRGQATRGRGAAVILLSLAAMTTWPLTGHAVVSPLAGALVGADVIHIAAMAVWLGGLVTLTVFLLRKAHPRVLGKVLPVWSRWAALSVVWLVAAGLVQSVVQVGSIPALWEAPYGQLLSVKVAILAGVLALAAVARSFVNRSVVTTAGPKALRATVGVEVLATTVILALSAVLVQVTPGRSVEGEGAEQVENGYSETLTARIYTLQFNIYPVELGEYNTVHGFTYTPEGKQLRAPEWTVTTRYLDQDLESISEPMLPLDGRNDALGALTFPLPGTYEVSFTIRTTEIDQATVRTKVTVPASGGR